jgi:hypothetical protein
MAWGEDMETSVSTNGLTVPMLSVLAVLAMSMWMVFH